MLHADSLVGRSGVRGQHDKQQVIKGFVHTVKSLAVMNHNPLLQHCTCLKGFKIAHWGQISVLGESSTLYSVNITDVLF